MRIGMLLMGGTYPPDIRVAKEVKVLAGGGHEVFLLTSDKDGRPPEEDVDGMHVRRYTARSGWLASKCSALAMYATWRSPLWEESIDRYVLDNGLDVLHVHDLPAVASALSVARRRGIPVVYDMHENYPAAVGFWRRGAAARILQTPGRYRRYERRAVTSVDRVVTVVDESRDRVISLGVDSSRVTTFTNVDDTEGVDVWQPANEAFTVAYAGGFGPHRGLESLICAIGIASERIPGVRLVLMGSGDGERKLRALVRDLGLDEAVEFTGWLDLEAMRERLAAAHVGAVPHLANEHTDSTVPHKLFQYMAMGLPVLVTDCAPLARVVRETGAGVVARSGDAESLASAIVELSDAHVARAASEAGLRAVAQRYNLACEGSSLLGLYDGLDA